MFFDFDDVFLRCIKKLVTRDLNVPVSERTRLQRNAIINFGD